MLRLTVGITIGKKRFKKKYYILIDSNDKKLIDENDKLLLAPKN